LTTERQLDATKEIEGASWQPNYAGGCPVVREPDNYRDRKIATALPQYRPTRLNIELDPCVSIVVAG